MTMDSALFSTAFLLWRIQRLSRSYSFIGNLFSPWVLVGVFYFILLLLIFSYY